jgi:hypothetical protein
MDEDRNDDRASPAWVLLFVVLLLLAGCTFCAFVWVWLT